MKEIVMSKEEIEAAASRIAKELEERLKDDEKLPVFIVVMRGALYFMAEVRKKMSLPSYDAYVQIKSYCRTKSTGEIQFNHDPEVDLDGRSVIVMEDVVDTGRSMVFLKNHLNEIAKPKQVLICALLDKKCAREVPIDVDYVGKTLEENKFVVGFGLDYNGMGRNSDFVWVPTEEEIAQMDKLLEARG